MSHMIFCRSSLRVLQRRSFLLCFVFSSLLLHDMSYFYLIDECEFYDGPIGRLLNFTDLCGIFYEIFIRWSKQISNNVHTILNKRVNLTWWFVNFLCSLELFFLFFVIEWSTFMEYFRKFFNAIKVTDLKFNGN